MSNHTVRNGFFKTFDGTRLYYFVEGSGPPLLFCYGLVCSKLHWSYQLEHFKKKYTVIWFDYRGHHLSDSPADIESLTIENMAKDIECLLDELKFSQVHVAGHSMGVNLVLEFYRRCPDRVKSMILVSGTARAPLETLLRSNVFQLLFPAVYKIYLKYPTLANVLWRIQGHSKIASAIIAYLGFNPNLAKRSDIELYVKMVSEMDIIITLQLLKSYEHYDATPWLDQINIPTLIIAGEKDLIIPKEAQETLHQLIPNSKFELIRNGSHCTQMDIPELLNIVIDRFLLDAQKSEASSVSSPKGSSTSGTTIKSPRSRSLQGEAS